MRAIRPEQSPPPTREPLAQAFVAIEALPWNCGAPPRVVGPRAPFHSYLGIENQLLMGSSQLRAPRRVLNKILKQHNAITIIVYYVLVPIDVKANSSAGL